MRLYVSGPPRGYPYAVVKPGSTVPGWRLRSVIVDNGAYGYYLSGNWPEMDRWVAVLLRTAARAAAKAEEVYVVLPDIPLNPARTALVARAARRLCRLYRCVYAMHWLGDYQAHGPDYYVAQMLDVEADLYALPMKLPAMVYASSRRRAVLSSAKAQAAAIIDAAMAARELGTRLHLMAPSVRALSIVSAAEPEAWTTIASMDTTSWTRAATLELKKRHGTISARSNRERRLFLHAYIEHLRARGVPLENPLAATEAASNAAQPG